MPRRGGWRRRGRKGAFRYEDAAGGRILDEARLARIEGLVDPARVDRRLDLAERVCGAAGDRCRRGGTTAVPLPPRLPGGPGAGEVRPARALRRASPRSSRRRSREHVRREPLTPEWTLAHAVTLINRAWFRVGSEQYARTSRTYGVTTLLKRHVDRPRDARSDSRFAPSTARSSARRSSTPISPSA